MLELSVENWDFLELSQHIEVPILVKEQDQSGWMTYDAQEVRVDWINVVTGELVTKTVAIVKMLV